MIILLAPSKTLDYKKPAPGREFTQPALLEHSAELVEELRKLSPAGIASLMDVSRKIANENFERFASWQTPFTTANAKQAVFAFKGDVYEGLKAETFTAEDLSFAQKHLRILSGLYGVLRPLDLMQPYRLEMGLRFKNRRGQNLYEFWGNLITDYLNKELAQSKSKTIVNLASREYFSVIQPGKSAGKIITPVFKEDKPGGLKVIGLLAKKARGMMSRFIIQNKLEEPEEMKNFTESGYRFDDNLSDETTWTFIR